MVQLNLLGNFKPSTSFNRWYTYNVYMEWELVAWIWVQCKFLFVWNPSELKENLCRNEHKWPNAIRIVAIKEENVNCCKNLATPSCPF